MSTVDVFAGMHGTGAAIGRDHPWFDFWLRASHGFRVLSSTGRLGKVRTHVFSWEGRLESLQLAGGILGRTPVEVRPDEIEWVFPHARRILVGDRRPV